MPQLSNVSEKLEEKRKQNFLTVRIRLLFKVEEQRVRKGTTVQKVSNLMQASFTVKGKVKKIGRCPVNQLKLFAVQ